MNSNFDFFLQTFFNQVFGSKLRYIFFNFINKPAVAAAPVLGLQKGLLVYEVFSTGSKLVALYFGFVVFQDALLAIILFSFFGAGAYMVLIFWIVASATRVDKRRDNA